ncbi:MULTISPECIES: helix-turn-helix domain-containing protein [Enterobacteriaceae]|uniref:helix-turn-helix domain-containing protein n=1 Tax=Enterobacteriaceae TaxID=543 RepID=UPI0035295295
MTPSQAADMLCITPRHCSHLLKRYRQSGPLGMNNKVRCVEDIAVTFWRHFR